jgi:hypothetical protein
VEAALGIEGGPIRKVFERAVRATTCNSAHYLNGRNPGRSCRWRNGGSRQDRPFLKEASNASDRPGAQHSSRAIERPESTYTGHSSARRPSAGEPHARRSRTRRRARAQAAGRDPTGNWPRSNLAPGFGGDATPPKSCPPRLSLRQNFLVADCASIELAGVDVTRIITPAPPAPSP